MPTRDGADAEFMAAQFRPDRVRRLVCNPMVRPRWIGGEDRFWYPHETADGVAIVEVDAATGARRVLDAAPAAAPTPPLQPGEVVSPDGGFAAFRQGHDLWLRETASGAVRALTDDGAEGFAYGKSPDSNLTTVTLKRRGIV
ncbi:MAG: DPP IV N-terminal domain-containing protein, partial [Acetobacteraceae bacterium]|nr:DPP IV N-terminal domain-containing protein [Acetobacteraceae bacterium]